MPRAVIAVSNEYGAGGTGVGRSVASRLGYELVDEQLPIVVARRLQISERDAEAAEDTRRSMGERVLAGLGHGTPELAVPALSAELDERYVAEVHNAVLEYATRGRVVIMGRGAAAILGRRPEVLRVFLHAPRGWRIQRVVEAHAASEDEAAAEIDRVDAARRAYLRQFYKIEFGDSRQYDLSLDVAQLGHECCAELIARVAQT
jgi:cytidylate kinase